MSEFTAAVAGMVVGFVLYAAGEALRNGWRSRPTMRTLLKRHFGRVDDAQIKVHSKSFPCRVSIDIYLAVTKWLEANCRVTSQVGMAISDRYMTSVGIAAFLNNDVWYPAALEYNSFDIGETEPVQCVRDSMWFGTHGSTKLALLWSPYVDRSGCGIDTLLRIDLAHVAGEDERFVADFFDRIEETVRRSESYRGKILSLDTDVDYSGNSSGIVVHRLDPVLRDDVILPEQTIRLMERNVIRFVAQRPQLKRLGMPTKKGLLMYGPPGTGKTHTIRFLAGALQGHTVLLATAEQMGNISQYIALARLLQPSIVVIEDVDLIGREREGGETGREALLNRLLNDMDGLCADSEILFLLTTNKPESLESALAARPGRVDQAIEFPLPDEAGRRKLIRLYASGAAISDYVVNHAARATEGVSASFIKELMRRAMQFHLECRTEGDQIEILENDIDQAIDELLFAGGPLNRMLLGAEGTSASDA
jgi:AAA+ superfamily predicted ATPase